MLPCQHLFHRNLNDDFLTDADWEAFRNMFEDSGFDVGTILWSSKKILDRFKQSNSVLNSMLPQSVSV